MSHRSFGPILAIGLFVFVPSQRSFGQAADESRERAVTNRFLTVLEKAPRRGTALDRVYGDHVERGELDSLIKSYQDRVAKDPKDGNAWMLLGLIESQRGRDSAAVAAFRSAESCLSTEALPAYYLGQALVLVGQPSAAAEAFERAVTRKASRNDLLEIYQALGKVYQRARRDDQALDAWNRLENLFPDDPRVQEQIASALAEESKLEPALARYEKLAGSARDPYRKVRFKTEAADLKVKLGRKDDALRDYEGLLGGLEPESWLFREVRRKIEDVFTRNDDLAGLAKYYEAWIRRSPEDIDAMSRLGKSLASQGRASEARDWFDRALKLAPTNRTLRLALIEQLANERKFAEAAAQYEALAKLEPNNPDVARDRGKMLLRDTSKPEPERKRRAAEVWRKLVEARPDDPTTAAQVAELFRQAGMVDDALALYKKAVDLAPKSPQYREYLGEYYHVLKRPEDAIETWRAMAEGPERTASNLGRLGEVLAGFGYKSQAIDTFAEATKLDPSSYPTRLRLTDLLLAEKRFDDAEAQLAAAEPLADSEEKRDEIVAKRVELDEAAGRLGAKLASLNAEVAGPLANDASTWRKLARYHEAARKPIEAVVAAEKAVALDGKSTSSRITLARLYEALGRFADAATTFRTLASLDRRAKTEHLTNVARLEARLGRKAEALEAGREVLAASPGNPESLQFFADLCFGLGDNEQGLETLRKAARVNEADPKPLITLADALGREFRTEEAIELTWKAFEKTPDLDSKLGLVSKLADLHLRRNQFDRLTARLERLQADDARRREATLFLGQAYATLGDFGTARRLLEGLLDGNARDTALLKQLSKLAEDEGDLAAATRFQQQLYAVAPDGEGARRLADLALRAGEIEVAEALWTKGSEDGQDLVRILSSLDRLSSLGRFEMVLATTNRLLRADPNNWEVLFREARTLSSLGRADEASARYQTILDLRRPDDEVSLLVKARRKNPNVSPNTGRTAIELAGLVYRIGAGLRVIRSAYGLSNGVSSSATVGWSPGDFGLARMCALADQLARARRDGKEAEWLNAQRPGVDGKTTDPRTAWDHFYAAEIVGDYRASYEAGKALLKAVGHEPSADYAFLDSMIRRDSITLSVITRAVDEADTDQTPPLPADELDQVRDALRNLVNSRSPLLTSYVLQQSMNELKRAGRLAEVDAEYQKLVDSAVDHDAIYTIAFVAGDRGDFDALRKLSLAFYRQPVATRVIPPGSVYVVSNAQGMTSYLLPTYYMSSAMKPKADAKQHGEILRLLDEELALASSPARLSDRAKAMRSGTIPTSSTRVSRELYLNFSATGGVAQPLDYPKANLYLDGGSILLLRNAFLFFKRDGLQAEFVAHVRKVANDAPKDSAAERQARLASSAVFWWAEDRESALKELARAVELTPGDVDLKLAMAELRLARREPDEALAIVDSIDAVDQEVTKRRELLALRLAVQVGRAERARQAAERLFGLRLDANTQVQLAAQMNQLGMLDLADAVLARTQRQVGNNSDALFALMNQYRSQGNVDAAVQIALQFLRRSNGVGTRLLATDELAQRQAIEVLASSGKLPEMIERVEAQVKVSPNSLTLQQTLATYYRAAGRLDKLRATNEVILKLRPDDAQLRVQVAAQLAQAGDFNGSIEQYRLAFQKDPSLLSVQYTIITTTFQQADRLGEAALLFEQAGLKNFGSPVPITNLLGLLLKEPKTFEQGVSLLGKALEAYPYDRAYLLNTTISIDPFWTRADAEELVNKAVLPDDVVPVTPWSGLNDSIPVGCWGQDGRVISIVTRLLDVSSRSGKLDDLARKIEAGIAKHPTWIGGKALLALVRIRQGKVAEGRQGLEAILDDGSIHPPFEALAIIGQEVRDLPGCRPLAIAAYERAVKLERVYTYATYFFKSSPIRYLALLDLQAGRPAEAVAVVSAAEAKVRSITAVGSNTIPMNDAYRRIIALSGVGSLYLEVGAVADSIRIFDELIGLSDDILLAKSYPTRGLYPTVDTLIDQDRQGLDRALQSVTRENLDATLEALLKPKDPAKRIDLLLVVSPREVDQASVRSLLASAFEVAAREPETLARLKSSLETASKAQPSDFEVRIAQALLVCQGGDPGSIAEAAALLDRLTDETPLASLAAGVRPNGRQADEAAHRLGLWLVARACWNHESTVEAGDRLAAKALEAARRQPDKRWSLAMLRERGLKSLEKGDRKGAEERWTTLLNLILEDPLTQAPTATTPATNRPASTGRPERAAGRVRVPGASIERFRQAAEFARLAAANGLPELSLKAVRESLKGGPPVLPASVTAASAASTARVVAANLDDRPDPTIALVESLLIEIDALWTSQKVAPGAAYETLRDVVMPPGRPTEIFLYDPTASRPGRGTVTAGNASLTGKASPIPRILARRAVEAGQVEDLRKKVAARQESPASSLAARKLLGAIDESK